MSDKISGQNEDRRLVILIYTGERLFSKGHRYLRIDMPSDFADDQEPESAQNPLAKITDPQVKTARKLLTGMTVDSVVALDNNKVALEIWPKPLYSGRPGTASLLVGIWRSGEFRAVDVGTERHLAQLGFFDAWGVTVARWQSLHDAAKAEARRINRVKKEKSFNAWKETLGPIKLAYDKASPAEKSAIISQVVYFLTTGKAG